MPAVPMAVKSKCLSIVESLKNTPFTLLGVESMNWRERLSVQYQDEVYKVDLLYGASGLCNLLPITGNKPIDILHKIINEADYVSYHMFHYNPSTTASKVLYNRVSSLCEEYGIKIVSIKEDMVNYKITYNMVTNARFAIVLFYINKKGFVSTATPWSEMGEEDEKLKLLLANLN